MGNKIKVKFPVRGISILVLLMILGSVVVHVLLPGIEPVSFALGETTLSYTAISPPTFGFASPSSGIWCEYDLYTLQGVPKGAVAEIVVANWDLYYERIAGVREKGSSIERKVQLHECEGSGWTTANMLVQTDAIDGKIEVYAEDKATVDFFLLGYFEGCDFTEDFEEVGVETAVWADLDLTASGVPDNAVVQIHAAHNTDVDTAVVGVRVDGSSLERAVDLDEAEDGGYSGLSYVVKSSADAVIEIKGSSATGDVKWYLLGWFGSTVDFTEGWTHVTFSSAQVDNEWESRTLTDPPASSIVAMSMMHQDKNSQLRCGVREEGNLQDRWIMEHEAEGGGGTGFMACVTLDADKKLEIFCHDVSESLFYYTGYFSKTNGNGEDQPPPERGPGMEQVLFGGYDNEPSTTGTDYNSLVGGYNWFSNEFEVYKVVSTDGVIKNLRAKLTGPPGAGKKYAFTLMVNGNPTALTFDIADGATTGSNMVNEIDISGGDYVSLRCIPTGTPAAVYVHWSSVFEGNTNSESLIIGGTSWTSLDNADIQYGHVMGAYTLLTTTEANFRQVVPTSGTIKDLYVKLNIDPGTAPDAYRFTLRKGGISQSLTVTITADDTTGNDLVNSLGVVAGDILTLMIEPLNSPSVTPTASWGMTFVADISGESIVLGGTYSDLHATDTEYNIITSWDLWNVDETIRYHLGQGCTLKKLRILLSGSPGADNKYDFTLRLGGADSNVVATVANAATTGNSGVLEDTVADDDYMSLQVVPTGTPTVRDAYWGFVCFIEPYIPVDTYTWSFKSTTTTTSATTTSTATDTDTTTTTTATTIISTDRTTSTGAGTNLDLWVDSYSDMGEGWQTLVGDPPYLNDNDANWIHEDKSGGAEEGYFGFTDTSVGGTINSVTLYIECYGDDTDEQIHVYIDSNDGNGYDLEGFVTVDQLTYAYETLNCPSLDTWAEINFASMYLKYIAGGGGDDVYVRRAYLRVNYDPVTTHTSCTTTSSTSCETVITTQYSSSSATTEIVSIWTVVQVIVDPITTVTVTSQCATTTTVVTSCTTEGAISTITVEDGTTCTTEVTCTTTCDTSVVSSTICDTSVYSSTSSTTTCATDTDTSTYSSTSSTTTCETATDTETETSCETTTVTHVTSTETTCETLTETECETSCETSTITHTTECETVCETETETETNTECETTTVTHVTSTQTTCETETETETETTCETTTVTHTTECETTCETSTETSVETTCETTTITHTTECVTTCETSTETSEETTCKTSTVTHTTDCETTCETSTETEIETTCETSTVTHTTECQTICETETDTETQTTCETTTITHTTSCETECETETETETETSCETTTVTHVTSTETTCETATETECETTCETSTETEVETECETTTVTHVTSTETTCETLTETECETSCETSTITHTTECETVCETSTETSVETTCETSTVTHTTECETTCETETDTETETTCETSTITHTTECETVCETETETETETECETSTITHVTSTSTECETETETETETECETTTITHTTECETICETSTETECETSCDTTTITHTTSCETECETETETETLCETTTITHTTSCETTCETSTLTSETCITTCETSVKTSVSSTTTCTSSTETSISSTTTCSTVSSISSTTSCETITNVETYYETECETETEVEYVTTCTTTTFTHTTSCETVCETSTSTSETTTTSCETITSVFTSESTTCTTTSTCTSSSFTTTITTTITTGDLTTTTVVQTVIIDGCVVDEFLDEALIAIQDDMHILPQQVHLGDDIFPSNTTDIEGRWGFNEGSGTNATDTSGNANHGVIYGATYIEGIDYHMAFDRYALRFDDTEGDYVNVTYSTDFDNGVPFTIELWYRPRTQTNATGTLVFEGSRYWIYYDNATSSLIMAFYDGAWKTLSSGGGVGTEWTYYVFMYEDYPPNKCNMTMFFNGTLHDTSLEVGTPQTGGVDLLFGRDSGTVSFLSGDLDVVRYYNRTMSALEILENSIILHRDGYVYSENMLEDLNVTQIVNFKYDCFLATGDHIFVQFSRDNSTWVDSEGISQWEQLNNGSQSILLTGLDWAGNFYYRANFTREDGVEVSPQLEMVAVCYSTIPEGGWNVLVIVGMVAVAAVLSIAGMKKRW